MLIGQEPRDTSVPVVVLKLVRNLYHHGELGITRSLGRLGIAVCGIHDDRCAPAAMSRYSRRAIVWRYQGTLAEPTVEDLHGVARHVGGRPILIPTDDVSSLFLDDNAEELKQAFLFPAQPKGLARSLSSKKELYLLCKRMNVATPETVFPQSRRELATFAREMRFPVVVKAIDPALLRRRSGTKSVIIAGDLAGLLEYYDRVEVPEEPNLMLQEYIPGGLESVWMFNGYFDARSECLVGFTGQKVRQHPPGTGIATLGICRTNLDVERLARGFMKSIGYAGIVDMGFRYDARDGLYKVFDVNPRIGTIFRLFVGKNGMDVVRALYFDLTGQPVLSTDAQEGRKWVVENYDIASSLSYARQGGLSLTTWLRSYGGLREAAWFACDDPVPFVAMALRSWLALARRGIPISRFVPSAKQHDASSAFSGLPSRAE